MAHTDECIPLIERARKLNNLCAIGYFGRSGSVFLQSLFDGHPHVICTPGLYMSVFHCFFQEHGHLPAEELIAQFTRRFASIFDARKSFVTWFGQEVAYGETAGFTNMGDDQTEVLQLSESTFVEILTTTLSDYKNKSVPRKLFFQAVHLAYQLALGRAVDDNTRIVFPLHTGEQLYELIEDFPEAKYIYMVREPLQSLSSWFKHAPSHRYICAMVFVNLPSDELRDYSRAIKLEELHREPVKTLKKLCEWWQLDWNDCLLESTFQGLKWWGDRSSPRLNGFSYSEAKPVNTQLFTMIDLFRLRVLFFPKYSVWQYSIPAWYGSMLARLIALPLLLLPFKMEFLALTSLRRTNKTPLVLQEPQGKQGRARPEKKRTHILMRIAKVAVPEWRAQRTGMFRAWIGCWSKSREIELL